MKKIATVENFQRGQPSCSSINPDQMNKLFGLEPVTSAIASSDPEKLNELFGLTSSARTAGTEQDIQKQVTQVTEKELLPEMDKLLAKVNSPIKHWHFSEVDTVDFDDYGQMVSKLSIDLSDEGESADTVDLAYQITSSLKSLLSRFNTDVGLHFSVKTGAGSTGAEPLVELDLTFNFPEAYSTPRLKTLRQMRVDQVKNKGPLPSESLKGKVVVLTGNPPSGMTKEKVSNILTSVFKVKAVELNFTKRTQVVIYNPAKDTTKAKKAQEAGLLTLTYEEALG